MLDKRIKYLSPIGALFYTTLAIYIIPSYYVVYSGDYILDPSVRQIYFKSNILFFASILFFPIIFNVFFKNKIPKLKLWRLAYYKASKLNTYMFYFYILILTLVGYIFFLSMGLSKFLLLGSDLNPEEFRFTGFDDYPVIVVSLMEVLKRVVYPITTMYILLNFNSSVEARFAGVKFKHIIFSYLLSHFLISLINIDRGPILTFFSIFFFYYFISSEAVWYKKAFVFFCFFVFISSVMGFLTFLQYNMFDYDFNTYYNVSGAFILNRIVLDPAFTAYKYGFELFPEGSEKLYFAYSRLNFLFTGEYTRSTVGNSLNVAPVGVVADAWRNFGYLGVVITAYILSVIFWVFEFFIKKASVLTKIACTLIISILCMYLFYGGLYSLGPITLILAIFIFLGLDFVFQVIIKNKQRRQLNNPIIGD